MISRRSIITTLLAAPAIIRTPGLLMPVKPFINYSYGYGTWEDYQAFDVELSNGAVMWYTGTIQNRPIPAHLTFGPYIAT